VLDQERSSDETEAGPPASLVHEAQPGGPRLEVADPAMAAAAAAAELAGPPADPLEQQRAHGPPLGRPASASSAAPAGAVHRLAARRGGPVPVPAAAERPRVARRRAEARRQLLVAASGGSRGSGGGGRVGAGCGGHGSWNLGGRRRGPGRPLLYATRHERRRSECARGFGLCPVVAALRSPAGYVRVLVRQAPSILYRLGLWVAPPLPTAAPSAVTQNAFLSCRTRTCAPNHFAWNESPVL
jgi:hypothetical protein